jgi:hypothetical protein
MSSDDERERERIKDVLFTHPDLYQLQLFFLSHLDFEFD